MTLLDDLKAAKDAVTEAEVTKSVVDSLIELGEGAKEYADMARVQVRENVPELAAKAEEVVAASRRRLPGAAAAAVGGAVLAAGVIVGGVLAWKHRGAGDQEESEDLAMSVSEAEDSLAEADDAEEAVEDIEESVDETEAEDAEEVEDEDVEDSDETTEDTEGLR